MAFHFFPTLYALPFIINKFLPENLSQKLLGLFYKHRDNAGHHGKFPAFYHMCKGPTLSQIKALENFSYSIEKYIGFFGHGYYEKIPVLRSFNESLAKQLLKHPIPWLTSYAYLVLSKP
jgi:hypothetical protein